MRFKNKGVLITGATGGIGRETCFHFAEEGATIAVTDLDLDLAERVVEEIKDKGGTAYAYELNVTNQEQTESVIEASAQDMGSLDIIFCNAGIREIAPANELSIEEWKNVIDVNVTLGVMGSTARCAYSTSKHAVVGMTKSLAMDLAASDIRVNAVGPGVIRTPLTEPYFQDAEMAEKIKQIHAMNRTGLPSEIARAVLFLASDEASFCTGHNLVIDGGWTAGKSM